MAAKSTTTNPLILQHRKTLESELEKKKVKVTEYRQKAEDTEMEIANLEEALEQLPDSVPARVSQVPSGDAG